MPGAVRLPCLRRLGERDELAPRRRRPDPRRRTRLRPTVSHPERTGVISLITRKTSTTFASLDTLPPVSSVPTPGPDHRGTDNFHTGFPSLYLCLCLSLFHFLRLPLYVCPQTSVCVAGLSTPCRLGLSIHTERTGVRVCVGPTRFDGRGGRQSPRREPETGVKFPTKGLEGTS